MHYQRKFEEKFGLDLTGQEPRTLRDYCRFLGVAGHAEFAVTGRGPGNGMKATPHGMAKVFIVAAADIAAHQAAEALPRIFMMPPAPAPLADEDDMRGFNGEDTPIPLIQLGACRITKACTWGEAVCRLFETPELAAAVGHIVVRHGGREGIIFAADSRVSRFCTDADAKAYGFADARGACRRLTVVNGAVLARAATALQS